MQQINLINPSLIPKRQWLPVPLLVGVIASALGVLTGHFAFESSAMKEVMAAAAVPSAAAAHAPGATAQAASGAAVAAEAAALQTRIATLESLRAGSRTQSNLPKGIAPAIDAIVASLSDSIWLTEIDIGPDGSLRISGGTLDPRALAAMAQRLSQVGALKGTRIGVLRIEPWAPAASESADASPNSTALQGHRFVLASLGHTGSEDTP